MLTVVVLSGDSKLAGQIELWVRQTMPEKLRIEHYVSMERYNAMLATPADPSELAVANSGAKEDQKKFAVFLVDVDLIPAKPVQWIVDLQKTTKEKGLRYIADGVPKVMVMAYETGVFKPDNFQNDAVDDLILKPVDKTLLLQKLEFLTTESRASLSPSFLFRAKTDQIIEVGRDVVIDEISEFAVAVRSPGPVPEGAFASIHCDVFGTKGARRLIGRVYESGKHPVREGEYLVRFAYFGISTEQMSTVRRFIKAQQTPLRTKTWGTNGTSAGAGAAGSTSAGAAGAAPAKPGLSKELLEKMALLKQKKIAVIDLNADSLMESKSMLEASFKGVIVRPYPSYSRLASDILKMVPVVAKAVPPLKAVAAPTTNAEKSALSAEPTFPMGKKLSVILRGKSHELVRFEPGLKKTDVVLAKLGTDWLEKSSDLVAAVDKEDKESLDEFLNFVEAGSPGRLVFRMLDAIGRTIYLDATGTLEKAGSGDGTSLLRIDLLELDAESYMKSLGMSYGPSGVAPKDPSQFRFDSILIDGTMLRPDPATWYESFVNLLKNSKVLQGDEPPPKVFVMSDPKARSRLDDFRIKGINDFTYKPLDRRFILLKFQAFSPTLVPTREPEAPPFVPCELQAKLGREVTMDEVAEYGVSIIHPTAFREKSHMRFFSRLFGDEGEWVAGRCFKCEKTQEKIESFRCQFMFFGPSEDLLQRIRRWIREDHVARKEKS